MMTWVLISTKGIKMMMRGIEARMGTNAGISASGWGMGITTTMGALIIATANKAEM